MRSKFPLTSKIWKSFFYDKWYVKISWGLILFITPCLEFPKYYNTALKFTFSLLKDGQRSESVKKKKKKKGTSVSCRWSHAWLSIKKNLVGVTKKITGYRKECRVPFQPDSLTKLWKHKSPPVKSLYCSISSSHIKLSEIQQGTWL